MYAVDAAGTGAGAGRVVVLLGWPIALPAIALAALAVDSLLATEPRPRMRGVAVGGAVVAVALCATVFMPGVFHPKHLNARPVNAPAAIGVGLAFALSLWSVLATRAASGRGRARSRADLLRVLLAVALLFAAVPWILANLGFYAGDVPGLRAIFMSKQVIPEPGYPHLRAVHLGNHDGLDGLLLALTCVPLLRNLGAMRRLRALTGLYLSLLVAYGLVVAAADWWGEQVVKRGWTSARIPSPIFPSVSGVWAGIVVAAVLLWLGLRRNEGRR